MKILIEVTQEDIKKETQINCFSCPVAIAIKRSTGFPYVRVSTNSVKVGMNIITTFKEYPLPVEVANFINNFDNYGPTEVSPISFHLDIPNELFIKKILNHPTTN